MLATTFGRRVRDVADSDRFLALERDAQKSEHFRSIDALLGRLLVRSMAGERIVVCSGDNRSGWSVALTGLTPEERALVETTFAVPAQQARGAWFLPTDADLAVGMANLPVLFRIQPRFAGGIAREQRQRVPLTQSADAVLHWALLNPLFETLFLPIELRGRQAGKLTREQFQAQWETVEALLQALQVEAAEALVPMRYGGGWSRLPATAQLEAKQRYLAALARQIAPASAPCYRAYRLQQLILRYYEKATADGLATRRQVLNKTLEPVLAAFFGGDWLAFLAYLGEPPHPDEQIVTALPETRLFVGGSARAQAVAQQMGLPAAEVAKVAAAFWQHPGGRSPIEERTAVLNRYWQAFDALHARQAPRMPPLWGLVEESGVLLLRRADQTPYQPYLYRQLLPQELLAEIHRCWGTTTLSQWPERLVSDPFPHARLAEALGPALKFWHGCALTAWFLCEGPYSRTDMRGLAQYHRRELKALEEMGTPVHPQLFVELIEGEAHLGPEKPITTERSTTPVNSLFSIRITMTSGVRRAGFERLRDIITRHRQGWTQAYWQPYLRARWESEVREASRRFHEHVSNAGKPPTPRQFAKTATPVVNQWFGGDLSAFYSAIGEKAPPAPVYHAVLPEDVDVVDFGWSVYRAIQARVARRTAPSSATQTGQDRSVDDAAARLAEQAPRYVQLREAIGREPTLKEFGRNKFERLATLLAPDVEEAWRVYATTIDQVLHAVA